MILRAICSDVIPGYNFGQAYILNLRRIKFKECIVMHDVKNHKINPIFYRTIEAFFKHWDEVKVLKQ